MALDRQTKMSPADIDAVLGRHETGVLSLADADEPYAIPISYGYDATAGVFYLRLVSTPESEKRRFLSSRPRARLVVYEEEPPTYRSVVATGRMEEVPPSALTVDDVVQYGRAKRPLFEVWAADKRDLDVQLFQLDPGDLSGRRIDLEADA